MRDHRRPRAAARLAATLVIVVAWPVHAAVAVLDFSRYETERILQHGPWPPPQLRDASNRVSGNRAAADFGAQLFFDPRLSTTGTISCASCHVPARAWSDRLPVAVGLDVAERNAKTVLDARFNRWFGWGGATDSLWAASLRPLLDPREMGVAEQHVGRLVRTAPDLACGYRKSFGHAPSADDEALFVDVAKALAAFQETLVSSPTTFDDFRDALARGDRAAAARYPLAAQRGLRLFIGRARCNLCHVGPRFTNDEFDKAGIPVRNASGRGR